MAINTTQITVAIAGANGKMGQEAVRAIQSDSRFALVAALTRDGGQATLAPGLPVFRDPAELLIQQRPDIWLDFTDATTVVEHIDQCIAFGVRPVVGATGYTAEDIKRWHVRCVENDLGGIAAPNFAIGALLMIRFATEAARFFTKAEIVEYHHNGKKDAPSGTAKRTAEAMAAAREDASATDPATRSRGQAPLDSQAQAARGLNYSDVPIHSVRLPGLVAHQEVMFGGTGEILTIRHDSLARTSFMPGVLLACQKVMGLKGMIYGLENLLW